MTRTRSAPVPFILIAVLGLLISGCALFQKPDQQESTEQPADDDIFSRPIEATVRFHLATSQQQPECIPMIDTGGRPIFLAPQAVLTERDIASARAFHGDRGSFVELTLNRRGSPQLARVTRQNIGRRLAILVNGRLVTAPLIDQEINSGRAYIGGPLTAEEVDDIAASINAR